MLESEQTREDKLIGTILDGKYRLDSFLSRGGMGAVFRGTHVMLSRPVAVKMINPDLVTSSEIVRRFQREARAATQLQHPNIVDVYDLGETADGTLYIVMELVTGASLKETIRANGPLDMVRIVRILEQVCDGLAQAHRRNIIHRDLKPHNIMLTVDASGSETAKIVDFGIAKTFESEANTQLTATGSTLGTPHYMSPEQATGSAIDGRSDIYSLGVILYEMLTGEVPFNDPSLPSVLVKHMTEPPQPPSLRRPDLNLPPALEAITLRCLAKSPADRYENVEAMAAALRRAAPVPASDEATLPLRSVAAGESTLPLATAKTAATPLPAAPSGQATAAIPPPPPLPTHVHAATIAAPPRQDTAVPGTHPTVPAPSGPPLPPAPPPVHRSGTPVLALAIVFVALAAAVGTGYYMFAVRDSGTSSAAQQAVSPAPQASPASAVDAPPTASAAVSNPTPTGTAGIAAEPSPSLSAAPSSSALAATEAPAVAAPAAAARTGGSAVSRPPAKSTVAAVRPNSAAIGASPPPAQDAAVARPTPAPAAAALPEHPSLTFACSGPPEICSALRSAMQENAPRRGLSLVRSGGDVSINAHVAILEERVERQFGTTMAVRSYSIDIEGDVERLNENVPMPPAQTITADARFGAERLNEAARAAAMNALERVQQYWAKKRQ